MRFPGRLAEYGVCNTILTLSLEGRSYRVLSSLLFVHSCLKNVSGLMRPELNIEYHWVRGKQNQNPLAWSHTTLNYDPCREARDCPPLPSILKLQKKTKKPKQNETNKQTKNQKTPHKQGKEIYQENNGFVQQSWMNSQTPNHTLHPFCYSALICFVPFSLQLWSLLPEPLEAEDSSKFIYM